MNKNFYLSIPWRRLRRRILDEAHNDCQMCKANGVFSPATVVHHIKFLKQFPRLALEPSNLIAICEPCHYKVHHTSLFKPQLNKERW